MGGGGGTADAFKRRAVQDSGGDVGGAATEVVDGHQPAADDAMAEQRAERREDGGIRTGMKVGEHSLVGIRPALRICSEGDVVDGRVGRKARAAAQYFRKRHVVGPDERQPLVKALELVLEFSTPESSERSGPRQHEHLLRPGKQMQDVVDDSGKIVDDRDGSFILAQRRVAKISLVDSREQQRRVGKELLAIPAREDRGQGRKPSG